MEKSNREDSVSKQSPLLKASLRPVAQNPQCQVAGCPACGGNLIEIRAKFQCQKCHRICETCCEGGRG